MPPNDSKHSPSLPTAESIKALQLPVGVKVRLDPTKRIDALRPVRFFDQDCACWGTNQGSAMESNMPFFNREVEEGFLVEPRNPIVILDGPAGYGKSYLLARLEWRYRTDERFLGKWNVVSVCLRTSQIGDQVAWLIDTMAQQLDLELKVNADHKDFVLLEIANQMKRQGKALLVLLDGLEQSSENELVWLRYRLPYQLRSVLGTDVRVILSGRHINQRVKAFGNVSGQVRQREQLLPYETCSLTPFDSGVVRGIIDWYAESVELARPDDEKIDRWVEEIRFLSGGHPEAIIELVDDLVCKTEWDWILQEERYIPELYRQKLFQKCLKTVSGSVLGRTLEDVKGFMLNGPGSPPVTEDVFQDLEILALLRRFEMSLLVPLRRLDLLSTEPQLLQGLLAGKGLSGGLDHKTGWQENDGIPRLIALQQRYEAKTRERCLELHRTLHKVFHYRAMGCDVNGVAFPEGDRWLNATNILLSVFESLYHFLSGIEEELQNQDQIDEMETHLTDLMIQYLDALKPYCADGHNALQRLWGMLHDPNQDDVRFLARWLLGDDIWRCVYDALKASLAQPESLYSPKTAEFVRNEPMEKTKGESLMTRRTLVDWLVDTLDLLRLNARSVLIERWEKRTWGQAVTPPAFDDKPRTREELRSLLPKEDEILIKLRGYQKSSGVAVAVNGEHIENLFGQMETAQKTVDRYNLELNKALGTTERIATEQQRDDAQDRLNQAVEELADILIFIFRP